MTEKYGFVYIWRDRKHKRFYVGSHWGTIDDNYICSSPWMKQAYKHRPHDFKRRILKTGIFERKNLYEEEFRWLSMIQLEKLKVRYYNINIKHAAHWTANPDTRSIRQKMRDNHWSKKEGYTCPSKGKPLSQERKEQISKTLTGRKTNRITTQEQHIRISENSKRLQAEGRIGMHGKKHSEETKLLMASKQSGENNPWHGRTHTPETRAKISQAGIGRIKSQESINKQVSTRKANGKVSPLIGRTMPIEGVKKSAMKRTGQKRSPEAKQRMREARLSYILKQKGSL